jgi:hypothetical protein
MFVFLHILCLYFCIFYVCIFVKLRFMHSYVYACMYVCMYASMRACICILGSECGDVSISLYVLCICTWKLFMHVRRICVYVYVCPNV